MDDECVEESNSMDDRKRMRKVRMTGEDREWRELLAEVIFAASCIEEWPVSFMADNLSLLDKSNISGSAGRGGDNEEDAMTRPG